MIEFALPEWLNWSILSAESLLLWLAAHPIITLSYGLLVLVAYNFLGKSMGLVDLFWNEHWGKSFLTGMAVSAFVAQLLFVRYLLGQPWTQTVGKLDERLSILNYFPGGEAGTADSPYHAAIHFLQWAYPIALGILILPAFFVERGPDRRLRWPVLRCLPMVAGMILSLLLVWGFFGLMAQWKLDYSWLSPGERTFTWPEPGPARQLFLVVLASMLVLWFLISIRSWSFIPFVVLILYLAGVHFLGTISWLPQFILEPKKIPRLEDHPSHLHTCAAWMVTISILLLLLIGILFRKSIAIVSVLTVLAIVVGVYGFLAFQNPGSQYLFILLLIVVSWAANRRWDKLRIPNVGDVYSQTLATTANQPINRVVVHLPGRTTPPPATPATTTPGLIDPIQMFDATVQRFEKSHQPKLICIGTSGGGVSAAVFTCAILEELEQQTQAEKWGPDFLKQIRLITGASGGMVGAGYWVAHHAQQLGKPAISQGQNSPLARAIARDCLSPVIGAMLRDLAFTFWPGINQFDRGMALEKSWRKHTQVVNSQQSPLDATFAKLLAHEAAIDIPSLIFSPMLVEDARRLLISNLDLQLIGHSGPRQQAMAMADPYYSRSAIQLFREFPATVHQEFLLTTAMRLSATFPFISPAVYLPIPLVGSNQTTYTARRVVDAGYFDNFGIELLTQFIARYHQEIQKRFDGILILQIRAYHNEIERQRLYPYSTAGSGRAITSPIEGIWNMRQKSPWYRNDQDLADLDDLFRNQQTKNGQPYFLNAIVESSYGAPLSWYLTQEQTDLIIQEAKDCVSNLISEFQKLNWF